MFGRIIGVPPVDHIAVAQFRRRLPLPQLLQRSPLLVLLEGLLLVQPLVRWQVPLEVQSGISGTDLVCDC